MTKTRDLADLGGGFIQAGSGAVKLTVEAKPHSSSRQCAPRYN